MNRVILCTDGDWNVGTTSTDALIRLIEEKRKTGVFLSVFGFGMGNLKDATLEQLADLDRQAGVVARRPGRGHHEPRRREKPRRT